MTTSLVAAATRAFVKVLLSLARVYELSLQGSTQRGVAHSASETHLPHQMATRIVSSLINGGHKSHEAQPRAADSVFVNHVAHQRTAGDASGTHIQVAEAAIRGHAAHESIKEVASSYIWKHLPGKSSSIFCSFGRTGFGRGHDAEITLSRDKSSFRECWDRKPPLTHL